MKNGMKAEIYKRLFAPNYLQILDEARDGRSYAKIAKLCDLSVGGVFNVFNGATRNPATVLLMAKTLNVPWEELLR